VDSHPLRLSGSDGPPDSERVPRRARRAVVVPAAQLDRRRAVEDLALLAEAGFDEVRVGVDWAWAQPRPGTLDGDAVELHVGLARSARELGVELHLTLLDGPVPRWFDDEGGFADARWALHWWPRWVEACADAFGDLVSGWVPLEHPLGIANSVAPGDPRRHGEVVDTLVSAWRDTWRILRGGPPVATAFGVEVVRAADETVQAAEAARRMDQLRWRVWLQGLRDGTVSIPGRADREVPDLAGSCDVVGIVVRHERDVLGLLHRAAEESPDRPLAVTYRLPTGADDARETAIARFLEGVHDAASGVELASVGVGPAFDDADPGVEPRGIVTRDRELKDSARRFLAGGS